MPTIIRPNFASAYSKANEILVSSRIINTFPFSPTALVKEQIGIPCRSYQKAAKYGVDMTAFGSESAIIMDLGGKQIIFYDKTTPESHINFSILHELGHPINGHDFAENDSNTYARYEVETNYFAAQLLMPEQILYVIPNVRWGDERTYTTVELPEKIAFLGVPWNSIVSIGTYGCIKSAENKHYFQEGLTAMLDELSPQVVLVYGAMPDSIFAPVKDRARFVNFPDWISTKRRRSA